MILALDTASSTSSVALIDAGQVVASEEVDGARRHAEALAPMLDRVLRGVEVDEIAAVACDVGPGPYSGLRVAIASAIACGLAWNVPVFGICSLDAIAAAVETDEPFGVAVDARRNEVYWARYSTDSERVAGPRVGRRGTLPRDVQWVDSELPHAAWVGRIVERLLAAGATAEIVDIPLAVHGDEGGDTEAALAGRVLLPPRALYLRRPDVTVKAGVVP